MPRPHPALRCCVIPQTLMPLIPTSSRCRPMSQRPRVPHVPVPLCPHPPVPCDPTIQECHTAVPCVPPVSPHVPDATTCPCPLYHHDATMQCPMSPPLISLLCHPTDSDAPYPHVITVPLHIPMSPCPHLPVPCDPTIQQCHTATPCVPISHATLLPPCVPDPHVSPSVFTLPVPVMSLCTPDTSVSPLPHHQLVPLVPAPSVRPPIVAVPHAH